MIGSAALEQCGGFGDVLAGGLFVLQQGVQQEAIVVGSRVVRMRFYHLIAAL